MLCTKTVHEIAPVFLTEREFRQTMKRDRL
jgi:hypothetical protein